MYWPSHVQVTCVTTFVTISPDDVFAMAELASAATVWPVSLLSPGCSYFDTALPPLACSNDYVRFFPGRPVMLTWTPEEVVEMGVGHRLESVDVASNRGGGEVGDTLGTVLGGIRSCVSALAYQSFGGPYASDDFIGLVPILLPRPSSTIRDVPHTSRLRLFACG
ncbi:hypothetical protein BDY19DRAFT_1050588 [Irpex rosettiformis]|uniref:Uncharacterized protein n=1 Tax=Irpex rosettiformis TaxID=378272 RepID=A0ACB8TU81_9APHY|nr:hypothetical protein BDY19DRAFT_1050588 [Irpex rosettiformis]